MGRPEPHPRGHQFSLDYTVNSSIQLAVQCFHWDEDLVFSYSDCPAIVPDLWPVTPPNSYLHDVQIPPPPPHLYSLVHSFIHLFTHPITCSFIHVQHTPL